MSDFTTLTVSANAGAAVTDASPTWNVITLGGANYEARLCGTGAGAGNIASASWPTFLRPAATTVLPEMWVYLGSDASGGLQVKTYDGTTAHYMQFRVDWDALGSFASAPIISFWATATMPAASPGTQNAASVGGDGTSLINGSADTSNTSYIKFNAYGSGVTAAGAQETPAANAAGTMLVTSGTAGAVSPGAGAWLATWQSAQGLVQYIQAVAIPKATTAGHWYWLVVYWTGPGLTGGTLTPFFGFQYSWV